MRWDRDLPVSTLQLKLVSEKDFHIGRRSPPPALVTTFPTSPGPSPSHSVNLEPALKLKLRSKALTLTGLACPGFLLPQFPGITDPANISPQLFVTPARHYDITGMCIVVDRVQPKDFPSSESLVQK